MEQINYNIWPEDEELFIRMRNNYISEEERMFFENIEYKQKNIDATSWDYLLNPDENSDDIFFVRIYFDEYLIGKGYKDTWTEVHLMNLSEALNVNIKTIGVDKDMTFFEWLRAINYKNINYNRVEI